MSRITARRQVTRITLGEAVRRRDDVVAVEEPLELRISGRPLTVTMRTPGHDVELAAGFLVSEGVIDVTLAPGVAPPDPSIERNFYTTSSCGVCGKASIDAVATVSKYRVDDDPLHLTPEALAGYPEILRAGQAVFERTGGLHAAGLFDGATGELLVLREDVGRHNAVDKVIGWALLNGRLPARGAVLMVSGRASFELTQKALMAGIPMLAAVSAPSSLAVELATEAGLTLVGFLRGPSMVVYSRPDRLAQST
jgi:FdhD protein